MDLGPVFARMAGVSLKPEFNIDIVIQAICLVQEEEKTVSSADRRAQSDCILVEFFGQWLEVVKKLHTGKLNYWKQ